MTYKRVVVELDADTKRLAQAFGRVERRTSRLTGMFRKAGIALAGMFGTRAVIGHMRQTLRSTNELVASARGVGFAVKNWDRLGHAMETVGVKASSLRIAMLDVQKRLAQGTADKYFRQAGLNPNELRKMRDPEQQFFTVLNALKQYRGNNAMLVGMGGRLFEEQSGKEMAKVINNQETFNRALKEYDRTSRHLDDTAIRRFADLQNELNLTNVAMQSMSRGILKELAPGITEAFKTIRDSEAIQWLGDELENLAMQISNFAKELSGMFETADKWISGQEEQTSAAWRQLKHDIKQRGIYDVIVQPGTPYDQKKDPFLPLFPSKQDTGTGAGDLSAWTNGKIKVEVTGTLKDGAGRDAATVRTP